MQAAKPPIRVPAGKRVVKMKMEPLLPMVMTPENVKRAGQTRWLTVEEVLTILRHSPGPFWPLESDRCNNPTSGSMFLFDRSVVLNYKDDGINWIKKRGHTRVREDHVKLRVNKLPTISVVYTHGLDEPTLHRRIYRLIDIDSDLVLVHYLCDPGKPGQTEAQYVNNRKWGSGVGSKGGLRGAAAVARSDARSSKLPAPRVPPPGQDANNKLLSGARGASPSVKMEIVSPIRPQGARGDAAAAAADDSGHAAGALLDALSLPVGLSAEAPLHDPLSGGDPCLPSHVDDELLGLGSFDSDFLEVFDAFLAPISPPPSFCTATSPFSGAAPPTGDEPYDPSATVANHNLMASEMMQPPLGGALVLGSQPKPPELQPMPPPAPQSDAAMAVEQQPPAPAAIAGSQADNGPQAGQCRQISSILDFSPTWDTVLGGTKVLICVAPPLQEDLLQQPLFLAVPSTHSRALAEPLNSTVLRCLMPAYPQVGPVHLCLEALDGTPLTPLTTQPFHYRAAPTNAHRPLPDTVSYSSPLRRSKSVKRHVAGGSSANASQPPGGSELGVNLGRAPHTPPRFVHDIGGDRKCKIRIVERLGMIDNSIKGRTQQQGAPAVSGSAMEVEDQTALASLQASGGAGADGSNPFDHPSMRLLDDHALSQLDDCELEGLLERLLIRVFGQLVHVATLDTELSEELNGVDSSGLGLLHYTCLYNLPTLVPVLIARGAKVNQRTLCGQTSLHLAAAAGAMPIVQALVEAGADVLAEDAHGLTAAARAYYSGFDDVGDWLAPIQAEQASLLPPPAQSHSPQPSTLAAQVAARRSPVGCSPPAGTDRDVMQQMPTPASAYRGSCSPLPEHEAMMQVAASAGDAGVNLLQNALSSLSLHEKCALSLSLSQLQQQHGACHGVMGPCSLPLGGMGGLGGPNSDDDECSSEDGSRSVGLASVLADGCRETLDAAMSLMGPEEISHLEDEARVIQHNVRAWLLRKRYKALREAICSLQGVWRERRGMQQPHPTPSHADSAMPDHQHARGDDMGAGGGGGMDSADTAMGGCLYSGVGGEGEVDSNGWPVDSEPQGERDVESAVSRLQTAARAMLARRQFLRVKRHTTASLVIQRHMRNWLKKHEQVIKDQLQYQQQASNQQQAAEGSGNQASAAALIESLQHEWASPPLTPSNASSDGTSMLI